MSIVLIIKNILYPIGQLDIISKIDQINMFALILFAIPICFVKG